MKQPKKILPEHVLCVSCGKPIHISEFAMIGKDGLYHGNAGCLAEYFILKEKNDVKNLGGEDE